jgi:hypothetical protein
MGSALGFYPFQERWLTLLGWPPGENAFSTDVFMPFLQKTLFVSFNQLLKLK